MDVRQQVRLAHSETASHPDRQGTEATHDAAERSTSQGEHQHGCRQGNTQTIESAEGNYDWPARSFVADTEGIVGKEEEA
jgi:hypothetical protein